MLNIEKSVTPWATQPNLPLGTTANVFVAFCYPNIWVKISIFVLWSLFPHPDKEQEGNKKLQLMVSGRYIQFACHTQFLSACNHSLLTHEKLKVGYKNLKIFM